MHDNHQAHVQSADNRAAAPQCDSCPALIDDHSQAPTWRPYKYAAKYLLCTTTTLDSQSIQVQDTEYTELTMLLKIWTAFQLQALLLSTVSANETPKTPIAWQNCTETFKIPADCGVLPVPLDYTSPNSTETLNLSLVKIKAAKSPSKGSILVNPGGPGSAGTDFMLEWGPLFLV